MTINKFVATNPLSVSVCATLLCGNMVREQVAACSGAEAAGWHFRVRKSYQTRILPLIPFGFLFQFSALLPF